MALVIDDALVAQFVDRTDVEPETARFFLEAAAGNFHAAVEMFQDQMRHAPGGSGARPRARAPPPRQQPHAPRQRGGEPRQARRRGLFGSLLSLPGALLSTTMRVVVAVVSFSFDAVSVIGRLVLPSSLVRGIEDVAGRVASHSADASPAEQAGAFVAAWRREYGGAGPDWLPVGFAEAARAAQGEVRYLFVYLHAPGHADTPEFCSRVLCDPAVAAHVGGGMAAWGGDVRRPEAHGLARQLRATRFPFCAVVVAVNGRTNLVASVEGPVTAAELLAALHRGADAWDPQLAAERADVAERAAARSLIEEQDAAFQESLEADRAKEAARQAARRAEEEARAAAAEAAAREKAEAEASARAIEEMEAAKERRRQEKRACLRPEPAETAADSALIRIRMADGQSAQRRFLASDSVGAVYDFVDSLDELSAWRYHLVMNYPRKVFGDDEKGRTLQDAGLAPRGMLFVQGEDE